VYLRRRLMTHYSALTQGRHSSRTSQQARSHRTSLEHAGELRGGEKTSREPDKVPAPDQCSHVLRGCAGRPEFRRGDDSG
jgi:hypothetical protein